MWNEILFLQEKRNGGQGEIRTHGRVSPTIVFKTIALNHSATCPRLKYQRFL